MKKRTKKHNKKIRRALLARGVGTSHTKLCPRCKNVLPREAFSRRKNGFTESYCRPCHLEYSRIRTKKYFQAHPELKARWKTSNRKTKLKRFGLTLEAFNAMVEAQGGKCAICNRLPSRENLDIDHCHKTGKVRGLLCSGCNRAIGYMSDDPVRLIAAANYLTK